MIIRSQIATVFNRILFPNLIIFGNFWQLLATFGNFVNLGESCQKLLRTPPPPPHFVIVVLPSPQIPFNNTDYHGKLEMLFMHCGELMGSGIKPSYSKPTTQVPVKL